MSEKLYYLQEKSGDKRFIRDYNTVYDAFQYVNSATNMGLFTEKQICHIYAYGHLSRLDLFEIELGRQVKLVVSFEPVETTDNTENTTKETSDSEVIIKD